LSTHQIFCLSGRELCQEHFAKNFAKFELPLPYSTFAVDGAASQAVISV
jgi:hypothetical protein